MHRNAACASIIEAHVSNPAQLRLGLTVLGGSDIEIGAIFVKSVQLNSPAFLAGVKPFDRILALNTMDMMALANTPGIDIIKAAPAQFTLLLLRSGEPALSAIAAELRRPTATFATKTCFRHAALPLLGERSLPYASEGPILSVVCKRFNGSFGCGLFGGTDSSIGGIFVSSDALDRDGLKCGDRVLAVEGISVLAATLEQFTELLKQHLGTLTFLVMRLGEAMFEQIYTAGTAAEAEEERLAHAETAQFEQLEEQLRKDSILAAAAPAEPLEVKLAALDLDAAAQDYESPSMLDEGNVSFAKPLPHRIPSSQQPYEPVPHISDTAVAASIEHPAPSSEPVMDVAISAKQQDGPTTPPQPPRLESANSRVRFSVDTAADDKYSAKELAKPRRSLDFSLEDEVDQPHIATSPVQLHAALSEPVDAQVDAVEPVENLVVAIAPAAHRARTQRSSFDFSLDALDEDEPAIGGESSDVESVDGLVAAVGSTAAVSPAVSARVADAYTLKTDERRVTVERVDGTLGFSLVSMRHGANGDFVGQISKHSARAGLQVGDRILRINDMDVTTTTHEGILALLKSSASPVVLVVAQQPEQLAQLVQLADTERKASVKHKAPDASIASIAVKSEPNAEPSHGPRDVMLQRVDGVLGLVLMTNDNIPNGTIYVKDLRTASAQTSGLRVGDCLLSVNGESIAGLGYDQVKQRLAACGDQPFPLRVEYRPEAPLVQALRSASIKSAKAAHRPSTIDVRDVPVVCAGDAFQAPPGQRAVVMQGALPSLRQVHIHGLKTASIGLVLASPAIGTGAYITHVVEGGLAYKSADIFAGDHILRINGADVSSSSAGSPLHIPMSSSPLSRTSVAGPGRARMRRRA